MATRRDVREAFYGELETSVSSLVPSSDVSQEHPNSKEDLPSVVHNDNYRKVPMNQGTAPTDVVTDDQGNDVSYQYTSLVQARFDVTIVSDDESEKEDIYEAIRTHFEPYTLYRDPSELQADVYRVEVTDAASNDLTDRDPTARGDTLTINCTFERHYLEDVTATDTVTATSTYGSGINSWGELSWGVGTWGGEVTDTRTTS